TVLLFGYGGFVRNRLDVGRGERTPVGQLDEPEPLTSFDDDVQPSVGKPIDHLDHCGTSSDLAQALVVSEQQSELASLGQALSDELAVTRLEDVQRRSLPRKQHHSQ